VFLKAKGGGLKNPLPSGLCPNVWNEKAHESYLEQHKSPTLKIHTADPRTKEKDLAGKARTAITKPSRGGGSF